MPDDDLEFGPLRDMPSSVSRLAEVANADAVVGPVQERDGRTVLTLASVSASYGLGMGFGRGEEVGGDALDDSGPGSDSHGSGEGGGGGGGGRGRARPVAVVEITDENLRVHQVVDSTRITIASLTLAAWSVFWITRAVRGFRRP
jgi:uncharacterized spore protein YtfJ